jgi:sn-glycerol 3-phosphate transport system permease protein
MEKRVTFRSSPLPYLLVLPQIVITAVFFLWPAGQALYQSLLIEDPFGLRTEFVWFENFEDLFADPLYIASFWTTAYFSAAVTALSLGLAPGTSASWATTGTTS